jgi:hypothetical protein
LLVATLALVWTGTPPPSVMLALIVVVATLVASLRWHVPAAAALILFLVGVLLRLTVTPGYSDVLAVTGAAAREMLAGGNPYGHGFEVSTPPGAPFAYGPLALIWYLPSLDLPARLEQLASVLVLATLALRGRIVGLAVFAVAPALLVAARDGSNDSSAGVLILAALLVALRLPVWGAVLLAAAVAFKPYALAWLPGLLAYGGVVAPLAAFLATTVVLWLPAAVRFGADSMAWSFRRADELHAVPYYSLAYALGSPVAVPPAAWQALRFAVGAALAAAAFVLVRSARSLVISGMVVFLATLYLGWWGTFAYLAALAPALCWHIDEWLGMAGQRAVWPGDPVGAWTARVDARWPILHPDPTPSDPNDTRRDATPAPGNE